MTDLPRQIPSTLTEQETQMPEWVKVEVCRLWNMRSSLIWVPADLASGMGIFRHALTIWQWCPEPVDPDLAVAAELFREWSNSPARRGQEMILAAIKRGRALERGEG